MKRLLLTSLAAILLLCPICRPAFCQTEWLVQELGYPGSIRALQASSGQVAWLAATTPQMAFGTTDGGASWHRTDTVEFENWSTQDLAVTGTGVLLSASTKSEAAAILRSEDGGITWTEVFRLDQPGAYINGVRMTSPTEGVAVADPIGGSWVVLLTSDGGKTWAHAPSEPAQAMGSVHPELGWEHSLAALPGGHIWFGTDNARVYRSTDRGASWSYGTIPSLDAYGLAFTDPLTGVAAVGNGLASTTNGGVTWGRIPGVRAEVCDDVVGVEGVYWAVQAHRNIIESTDNGVTWDSAYSGEPTFSRIHATIDGSSIVGWAGGGTQLVRFTMTTAGTGPAPETPQSIQLYQNYPNPFNPTTMIRYSLPGHSSVTLSVFDALGQHVATLVNGEQEAGYHEVTFDAQKLASGMYFCRLEAGHVMLTKRLMLVR